MSADLEQLRSQLEQILGNLDTRRDAMMKRRIQAKLDNLDGLLENRSESRNRGAHLRDASGESRVNFETASIETEEGPMDSQEERVTHPATPLGVTGLGSLRISEEALLAVGNSRTNNLREKHMRVEKLIPQTGITRTREQLSPVTRTVEKFKSLN